HRQPARRQCASPVRDDVQGVRPRAAHGRRARPACRGNGALDERLALNIAVVDYGMGNLKSVSKALEHVAPRDRVTVTADPKTILSSERIVVPGQGAMPDCMRQLAQSGARDAVIEAAEDKPWLGLCIGLQMLFERGEEGDTPGLGLLPGRVPGVAAPRLQIPHMGWNEVMQEGSPPMWQGILDRSRL